jgi:predicted phage tail protein
MKLLRGSGGGKGGGGGRTPIETPDNLQSKQSARVIDVVSEGEIEGLIDGLKSVYLDDTPLQNADGSMNFDGVTLQARTGTQSQSHVPGFSAVEAEIAVGTEVKFAAPVTRSISNTNATAVRVTVSVPQLTQQNTSNGDLTGTSVEIAIDVQQGGAGFVALPLRSDYSSANMAISSAGAVSSLASIAYQITVTWSPVQEFVQFEQSCTYQLQYRVVGAPAWSAWEEHTFSGAYQTSKTFDVGLPNAVHEFRVVKTAGTRTIEQYSESSGTTYITQTGIAYGGTVAITGATAYQPFYTDVISGKTTSRYQRAYRIALPGTGPWDIRVRRLTADSTSVALQNKTFWDSYTEIIDAKLTYPNTALVALSINAEQFRAIPRRAYEMKGLRVRVPSNYNPVTREYAGVWNGTFSIAWTNNPAWCFYDLLTADRYGLGEFIDAAQVDKWALYQIGQYCDEFVDNGYGGIEPRFACNLYLQSREDAYKVINAFASIFRGMVYWAGGAIAAVQDAPRDPVALFTPANTVGDGNGLHFNYAGSSAKQRHTVALVSWNDPQDRYRQKIEYVEDPDGIARYGVVQTEIVALGCTSRGQAHRLGRWLLYTERMETQTITFRTGLEGLPIAPGDVFTVSDPVRAGVRMGGRLLTATASTVTLDAQVVIAAGKTYTLWVVLPDGTVESRSVTNAPATTAALTLDTALSAVPQAMAVWVLAASDLVPETWRAVSISEVDGIYAEITALAYRADKYAAVEQGLVLEPLQTSSLSTTQAAPTDLNITEALYLVTPAVVGAKITVSWAGAASYYELRYRRDADNWISITTEASSVDIAPIEAGQYQFSLIAINAIGSRSQALTATKEVLGKVAPPADVAGFTIIKSSGVALASWARHPDLDVQVGGRIVIRHTPATASAGWNDGYVVEEFSGSAINGLLPLMTGTYFAKAVDSSGNWSQNAVYFVATEGMVTGFVTLATTTQAPAFAGTKTSVAVADSALQLDAVTPINDITAPIDSWDYLDSLGGIATAGSYAFDSVMDLTSVATRRIEADIVSLSFDTGDTIDSRLDQMDSWDSFNGNVINDCDVTLYAATTNDNPTGSPTWSEWTPFFVSDFTCRALKFRLDFVSTISTHNIAVSRLTVRAKIPA